jgi:hypothetical protein
MILSSCLLFCPLKAYTQAMDKDPQKRLEAMQDPAPENTFPSTSGRNCAKSGSSNSTVFLKWPSDDE